ncbi:MAG: hypothetical protein GY765_29675 [bacterium]|nr:hypothetical protein [bacterium]
MNTIKIYTALLLLLLLSLLLPAEKRPPQIPMVELTDPDSPSYVPYPFPKKRTEIIADLKYYCETFCDGTNITTVDGKLPVTEEILMELFKADSRYTIGEISKIRNRNSNMPDHYSWLIHIMDKKGSCIMRFQLLSTGLMAAAGAITDEDLEKAPPRTRERFERWRRVPTPESVTEILADRIGPDFNPDNIKKIEQVAYPSTIGASLLPVWEIKMKGGTYYYYSENRHEVYAVEKKIKWKKNDKGHRPAKHSLVSHPDFLPDMIDDQVVILRKIHKKD